MPTSGESKYFWADGSEHIGDFAFMPIRDAAGQVKEVVGTGMDITERVEADKHHRALEEGAEALAEVDRTKTAFFA